MDEVQGIDINLAGLPEGTEPEIDEEEAQALFATEEEEHIRFISDKEIDHESD